MSCYPLTHVLALTSPVDEIDHVYLSAPWNTAEGAPWLIGRIVEFLDGASGDVTKLRVAYYLRPRDLNNRQVVDFRLLTASMHTEVCSASYLRGKCRVLHRDQIDDLDSYKQQPDCFYFYQVRPASQKAPATCVLTSSSAALRSVPASVL